MLAQPWPRSVDKAKVAQRFCLLGVLGVLNQQRAVWAIDISLWRAHDLLNALDSVAVSLPNFGGVYACHGSNLLKPQPCTQGSGFPPGDAQEDAPIARWAFLFLVSLNTSTGFCSWHPVCLTPYRPRGWTLSIGTFFCWCHISFALPDPIRGQSATGLV